MTNLYERLHDFVVDINHFPYYRTEVIDRDKGIIRVYGKDGNKEKINSVRYSKPYFTREYIEANILPKYDDCRLCSIGQEINVPIKRNISLDIKPNIAIILGLGLLSVPLILYSVSKKLTK